MKFPKLLNAILITLAFTATNAANAHGDEVKYTHPEAQLLMKKDMADIPNKEVIILTVDYKPGEVEFPHRHDAHCFVYVLEGSIVMGVKGSPEITLSAGQSFYEGPQDIHTVGRNASTTKPAKFVVMMIKNKGALPVLPIE